MKQFLLNTWDEIKEIILHLFGSTIVMTCCSFVFFFIDFVTKYLFSEQDYSIILMEIASKMTILSLFIVYVSKGLIRAIKNINK
jgi:hypothetical protein